MVSAIILAGGKGTRMGRNINKQYIEINGKPIIYHTIKQFKKCSKIDEIILVLPKDEIEYCKVNVLEKYNLCVDKIVSGGKERQDSVLNGLNAIENCEIVLIHDGARPFTSKRIIEEGIENCKKYGAAAPGVMPKDTIKIRDLDNFSIETLDRNSLVAIQTPQIFKYNMIYDCHNKVVDEGVVVTDDTMVVERYNNKVYLYDGCYTNIKITTPEDLLLAEILSRQL